MSDDKRTEIEMHVNMMTKFKIITNQEAQGAHSSGQREPAEVVSPVVEGVIVRGVIDCVGNGDPEQFPSERCSGDDRGGGGVWD